MRRLIIIAGVVAAVGWIVWGVHLYRHRYVRGNGDLVRLLPPGDLNLIYADLGMLRQAQLLGLLANIKVAPDKEYSDFIRQTGFDYTRDLDAIAIGTDPSRTFLVGRGRFDWEKLKGFAVGHQGRCESGGCSVPGTTPGRWVNLITIQPDVLAVAISQSATAADEMRPPGRRVQEVIPAAAVWAKLSHALLASPSSLPLPLQIFAVSLQSAESVTLLAETGSLQLRASFANAAAAETARSQLEMQIKFVRTVLKDEKPDRASLSAVLTGGLFQVTGSDLKGIWPVHPELLKALQ